MQRSRSHSQIAKPTVFEQVEGFCRSFGEPADGHPGQDDQEQKPGYSLQGERECSSSAPKHEKGASSNREEEHEGSGPTERNTEVGQ